MKSSRSCATEARSIPALSVSVLMGMPTEVFLVRICTDVLVIRDPCPVYWKQHRRMSCLRPFQRLDFKPLDLSSFEEGLKRMRLVRGLGFLGFLPSASILLVIMSLFLTCSVPPVSACNSGTCS